MSPVDEVQGAASTTFDRIAAVAARVTGAPVAAVTLVDGDELVLVGLCGELAAPAARRTAPLHGSFLERILRRGGTIAVRDAREEPGTGSETVGALGLVACAGAPIVDPHGTVAGAVLALDFEPHAWGAAGVDCLDDLAAAVAAALAQRAGGGISRAETRLAVAHTQVTEGIAFGEPLRRTLQRVADALQDYLGGVPVSLCVQRDGDGDGAGRIGATGQAERLSVQLRSAVGDRLGVLCVWGSGLDGPLPPAVERRIRAFSGLARIAIERSLEHGVAGGAAGERGLRRDALTGLLDRRAFTDVLDARLAGADVSRPRLGVLALGLDGFGTVNESLGHAAGDEVLATIAQRLAGSVGDGDVLARFGGDEFVVLGTDPDGAEDWNALAHRMQAAAATPIRIGDRTLRLTASIGVAVDDPASIGGDLVRDAEIAMHSAKRDRRGSVRTFRPALRDEATARLRIAQDLRGAIARGELCLAFDPVVTLEHPRSVIGLEAVVRWQHPERGLLHAPGFMPEALELGLAGELDRWALRHACELFARCREDNPGREAPVIAVNVTSPELCEPAFAEHLERVLAGTGVPPHKLLLEIGGTAIAGPATAITRALEAIKALGVLLALDDFGDGGASLGRFVRLPVDGVKLDRSFATALTAKDEAGAVVEATMRMAAGLGRRVVPQGVETEEQAQRLLARGCRCAQGPLFAQPAPEAMVSRTLLRSLPAEGTVGKAIPRLVAVGEPRGLTPGRVEATAAPGPDGDGLRTPPTAGPAPKRTGRLVTINKASAALNVSPSTLRRWADEGRIEAVRTPGGHRRFALEDIARLRSERPVAPVVRALDLPAKAAPQATAFLEDAGRTVLLRVGASMYEPEAQGWFASASAETAGTRWIGALAEALAAGDSARALSASSEYMRAAEVGGTSLLERYTALDRLSRVLSRSAQHAGYGIDAVAPIRRVLEAVVRRLLEQDGGLVA